VLRHTQILQTRRRNLLRRRDFCSPHIIQALLRSFSRRNTVAEAEQAVADTVAAEAPAVAGQEAEELAVGLVAGLVAGLAEGPAVVRVVAPEVERVAEPVAERAGPLARAEAGLLAAAHIAILNTIRRGRSFRNSPRPLPPISR